MIWNVAAGVLSTLVAVLAGFVLLYGTAAQTIDQLATAVSLTVLAISAGIRLLWTSLGGN